jgi:hypothetical protein
MKIARHAAALALVGWYLMTPPSFPRRANEEPVRDDGAPVSQWKHISSWDTAKACNAELERLSDSPIPLIGQIGISAKCIASDDPRLKENR